MTLKPGATQELERPQTVPKASKISFGGRSKGFVFYLFGAIS